MVFTLHSGLLFFSLSYIFYKNVTVFNILDIYTRKFWVDFAKYLIPTNFDLMKIANEKINYFFYVFYILGKISIGYGIVEVVQAFRKFNTKGN